MIQFYQEYDTRGEKRDRSLVLIVKKKRAFHINRTQVVDLWLSTAQKLIEDKTLHQTTQQEALQDVPELETFLQQLPTLPAVFYWVSLKKSEPGCLDKQILGRREER